MNTSKKISLSVIVGGLGVIAFLSLGNQSDAATSVTNTGNKEYYKDPTGELWIDRDAYESQKDNSYYQAEDGTIWQNEYRYDLGKER